MAKSSYDYKYSKMCTKEELSDFVEKKRRERGVTDVRAMQINATTYLVVWKKGTDDAEKGR